MRYIYAILLTMGIISPALAHPHKHYSRNGIVQGLGVGLIHMMNSLDRPRDCFGIPWCGCWMRHQYGVSDKAYNRAPEWAHFGHAAGGPGPGVIVVWSYHVGRIVGGGPGHWLVESGNFNNRVAIAEIPLRGVIAYREP
jgi:hypothetical protein